MLISETWEVAPACVLARASGELLAVVVAVGTGPACLDQDDCAPPTPHEAAR